MEILRSATSRNPALWKKSIRLKEKPNKRHGISPGRGIGRFVGFYRNRYPRCLCRGE